MKRISQLLAAILVATAAASALAATPAGRLGRELLQSGTTCAAEIPHCTARRCTTRILGSRETYVCLRCKQGFIPARGIDGRSIVQCVCPAGTYVQGGSCVACPIGSFCVGGNTKAKTAVEANLADKTKCNASGEGLTTKSTGARKYTDCVAEGGYVLPKSRTDAATKCAANFYAPEDNRLRECLRCQSGLQTPSDYNGAHVNRIDVCQVPPGKFWELNVVRDCPKGLFRKDYKKVNEKAAIACESCPNYWTTPRTASEDISECNIPVEGYQVKGDTQAADAITAQGNDFVGWDPSSFELEPCPIGTYYDANTVAKTFKCAPCPYGATTRATGALSVDECMVPPGYYIKKGSQPNEGELKKCPASVNDSPGYYRSGWVSFSQALDDNDGSDACTACGVGILSEWTEVDEKPKADGNLDDTSKVAATSASCYITGGYGITFDPSDFKLFKAMECPENTYGVADKTFGLINAPCKACGKNLKSGRGSTGFTDCKNPAGFGYTSEGANQCPPHFWATANSMAPCEPCPEGKETDYIVGDGNPQSTEADCKPPAGFGVYDPEESNPWAPKDRTVTSLTARPCPIGYKSAGGANAVCEPCAEGLSTSDIGSKTCDTCAAGYGQPASANPNKRLLLDAEESEPTCEVCPIGHYSSGPSPSCSVCPRTTFSEHVGAEYESYGITFRTGLKGKETCVPRYAAQAPPAGDRMALPDAMFGASNPANNLDTEDKVKGAVKACVEACPADKCCIAEMQLTGNSLSCKHALLNPLVPVSEAASGDTTARLYYKLPPSEMAAASTNGTVAAKTIPSGIYATCDISAHDAAARNAEIGTSYDSKWAEDNLSVPAMEAGKCNNDADCQAKCNAVGVCWGYIYVNGSFYLRGGENRVGGRTFFSSPDAGRAAGVAGTVSKWIAE